jgi:AcrR family transcriptional regulator
MHVTTTDSLEQTCSEYSIVLSMDAMTGRGSDAQRTKPAEARSRRRYQSPLRARRAAETRQALITAAHRLFVTRGWLATGMRDVAAEAGVATETVYAYFSSKRGLFQAVVDLAVVGDDLPVPVAERAEFVAAGRGTHRDRTAAAARLLTAVHGRTAPFAKVIREAATSDDEIADVLQATRERQRRDVGAAAELIMGREATETERDGLWAVTSPEVYLLLLEESGWTPAQYEAWMAQTLERVVPRSSTRRKDPR